MSIIIVIFSLILYFVGVGFCSATYDFIELPEQEKTFAVVIWPVTITFLSMIMLVIVIREIIDYIEQKTIQILKKL